MKLDKLIKSAGFKSKAPRKGRGNASKGTYAGRGGDGQKSRSGGGIPVWFEGGQTNLFRRLPKLKGFNNINRLEYQAISLSSLELNFENGDTVDLSALYTKGLVNKKRVMLKVLGNDKITKKLTIKVEKISKAALKMVEKSGGTFESIIHHNADKVVGKKAKKVVKASVPVVKKTMVKEPVVKKATVKKTATKKTATKITKKVIAKKSVK